MSSGTSEIVRRPRQCRSKSKPKKTLPLPKIPVESSPTLVPTSDTNEIAVPLSGPTRRRPGAKPKSRRKSPALPSSTALVDLTNETNDIQVVPSIMSDLSSSGSGPAKGVINKSPATNCSPLPSPTSGDVSLFPSASTAENNDDKMTGSAPAPDLGTVTSSTRRMQPGRKCNRKKVSPPLPPTVHVVYDLDSYADPDYQDKAADESGSNRLRKRKGSTMPMPGPGSLSLPKSVKSRGRPKKAKSDNAAVAKKGRKISQVEVFSGAGHSLNSASQSVKSKSSNVSPVSGSVLSSASVRMPPSLVPCDLPEEKRRAARAALDRYEKQKSAVITDPKELAARRRRGVIKAQARKELEAEKQENQKLADRVNQNRKGQNIDESEEAVPDFKIRRGPADLKNTNNEEDAGDGVYFSCSLFPGQVLPLDQMEAKILEFLCERPKEEMGQTSCSIIHSCNKDKSKVAACVDTLCKILEKIIESPTETKFHKIRINNTVFQTKVAGVIGVPEFLAAAGFFMTVDKGPTGEDEDFYQIDPDFVVISELRALRDTLKSTEPIRTELHRDLQVLMPAAAQIVGATHVHDLASEELAPEFFSLTTEELRREQNRRTEIAKRELTLRTKKTREEDEFIGLRGKRVYRYASIRIRFPDGFTLQGTFGADEKVQDIHLFVAENLANPWTEFTLVKSGGEVLAKHEVTLAAYNLLPASILNFRGDSSAVASSSSLPGGTKVIYLKPEILPLVQGPRPCQEVSKSEDGGNKS